MADSGVLDEEEVKLDLEGLDLTTDDINFDEIDDDLDRFQQDDIVREALEKGVDLRHYSRHIDKDLRAVEIASLDDYVRESDNIAQLYQQITTCESILESMEEMLQGFRSNLGGISQEIKTLQNESLSMNIKLRNRRSVSTRVNLFLNKVAVSETMISVICDGPIDTKFIQYLESLSEKLKFTAEGRTSGSHKSSPASTPVTPSGASSRAGGGSAAGGASGDGGSSGAGAGAGGGAGGGASGGVSDGAGAAADPSDGYAGAMLDDGGEPPITGLADLGISPPETLAGRDALPELERLRIKAVTRVREFLLLKIAELRQPKTNVQKLQEYVLLKFRYLMHFLTEHSRQLAAEVQQAYVDTMGRMLQTMFRTYHACLSKFELHVAGKNDLIAVETSAMRVALFSSRVDLSKRTDTFCLGSRAAVLDEPDAPPIHIHVAQAEKQKHPYEVLFRSLQKHLMDAAAAEYSFTLRFFGRDSGDVFLRVFARSLSQVLENLEDYLCQCYDAVGLLLMIHITHQHRKLMHQKKMSCMEPYFNRVNMLLWPRFKAVFDLNLQSVRSANPRKLGSVELHPHYITRRYAEFAASVLTLHRALQSEDMSDEMVIHNMSVLRNEVMRLLSKLSEVHTSRKERTVFLINNINQCKASLTEARQETTYFDNLLARQIGVYVEEELASQFMPLIKFVKSTEASVAADAVMAGAAGAASPGGAADASAASGAGAGGGGGAGAGAGALPPGVVPRVDKAVAETLVRDFARCWRQSIGTINASVMKYFASFKNGMEILKQVLTQLLLYYTRFQEIIRRCFPGTPIERDMVRIPDIFAEIRKYSRTFE